MLYPAQVDQTKIENNGNYKTIQKAVGRWVSCVTSPSDQSLYLFSPRMSCCCNANGWLDEKNWKVNHITSQRAGDKITKMNELRGKRHDTPTALQFISIAIDKMVWDKATQQDMICLLFPFFFAVVVTVELLVSRLQNDKFPEEKVAPE